jgi:hypothetical protein
VAEEFMGFVVSLGVREGRGAGRTGASRRTCRAGRA